MINFLRQRRLRYARQQQQDLQWLLRAGVGFVAVLVVSGGVFGARWWISSALAREKALNEQLELELADQGDLESRYLVVSAKVAALTQLLEERSYKQRAFQFFSTYFQPPLLVEEMVYEGTGALPLLTFSLLAPDVFWFEKLLQALNTPEVLEAFPQLATGEITRTQNGAYQLRISIGLEVPS